MPTGYYLRTKDHIKINSESHKGQSAWNKNKTNCYSKKSLVKMKLNKLGKIKGPQSKETKRKIRLAAIQYRKEHNEHYIIEGKNEKLLLDKQEIIDGCKIIRHYEIKELGYFPDGYCKETNTIYEVYEKYHDRFIFKDLERENVICNYLSCDFIILYDRTH